MITTRLTPLVYKLKDMDSRASYFVAKELALIEINIMWYPDQMEASIARLKSLTDHIKVTFKNCDVAQGLNREIFIVCKRLEALV